MDTIDLLPYLKKCAEACTQCSNYLESLDGKHKTKIVLSRDCGEVCTLTAKMIERESSYTENMIKACVALCDACEEICGKEDSEICKKCAEACRNCADVCLRVVSQHLF